MANFFKGILRANTGNYGDIEGPMTNLKSGKLAITLEKGKCIAWIVGQDDVELSKENVKKVELVTSNVEIYDLSSGGGKRYVVNIYSIEMADGSVGTLRLVAATQHKVLALIQ